MLGTRGDIMLKKINISEFDDVYKIMEQSFPKEEIREYDRQKSLMDKEQYNLMVYKTDEGEIGAFVAYWVFDDFVYGEHLAVAERGRNNNLGSKIMNIIKDKHGKPFVLEVEPPETEITKRRVGFYERLGFIFNDFEYMQPPMRSTTEPIPLKIMSYPNPVDKDEFESKKNIIHSVVYGVKK